MGRELKRVALDFEWPTGKVWPGFVNPYWQDDFKSKEAEDLYESWEEEEPPTGEGWQLWENVSEGSPVSPVFATSGELVDWMVSDGYSRAGAEKFIEVGYAPPFIFSPQHGFESGVDAMGHDG